MDLMDGVMALIPRVRPAQDLFDRCRIIAHRGAHGPNVLENTVEAFDSAIEIGAWAIEFDIRWTRDDVPVVHHDKDCVRTFNDPHILEENAFELLRVKFAKIPSLKEVVERYRGKTHFMIELKKSQGAWTNERLKILGDVLSPLRSVQDYHLMSLDAELLLRCDFAERAALLPVAEFNGEELSQIAIREKMGGLTGHYALVTERQVRRHLDAGQHVGTGFIASPSVMNREIARGVDLIFTNDSRMAMNLVKRPSTLP